MSTHHIVRAVAADLPEIVAIYNSTIASRQATADLEAVSVASRQAWFEVHQKPHRPIYVVKNAHGEVLAWGSFSDYYARAAYDITAEISIYVRENFRGMGLGKAMLTFMLQEAPYLGIVNVVAVIFGHNRASLSLFTQFDFVQWGCLPQVCDLGAQYADVLILGRKII